MLHIYPESSADAYTNKRKPAESPEDNSVFWVSLKRKKRRKGIKIPSMGWKILEQPKHKAAQRFQVVKSQR